MAKIVLLGLTAWAAIGLGQEGGAVSFELQGYDLHPMRWELAFLTWLAWKGIVWLTGRDLGDPAASLATAFTGVFVVAPFQVSWLVNTPAMIWLSLVGEATPWAAVVMVWIVWFVTFSSFEVCTRRAAVIRLDLTQGAWRLQ